MYILYEYVSKHNQGYQREHKVLLPQAKSRAIIDGGSSRAFRHLDFSHPHRRWFRYQHRCFSFYFYSIYCINSHGWNMAPSLQELIDFLLTEIALCGDQGRSFFSLLQAASHM